MGRKTIVLIVLSCIVIAMGYSTTATTQTQRPVTIPKKFRNALVGKIGDKYAIHMDLVRDDQTLVGTYYYDSVGDEIEVSGTIEPSGQFKLTETDREGKTIATFNGKITISTIDGQPALAIAGTWKKTGAAASLSLSLTEIKYDLGLGAKFESKKINQTVKKPKYTIEIEYPQIIGFASPGQDKFNKFIGKIIADRTAMFKKDMADSEDVPDSNGSSFDVNYSIEMASGNLIAISFMVGTYNAGAAHGNYFYETVNFDTEKGTDIKLKNLFKPNSKYLSVISRYCIAQLKKKLGEDNVENINTGAAPTADNYDSWCITDSGLMIFFNPYQVASYAEGPQQVLIRFSKSRT